MKQLLLLIWRRMNLYRFLLHNLNTEKSRSGSLGFSFNINLNIIFDLEPLEHSMGVNLLFGPPRTELCTPALKGIFVKTVIETLMKKLFSKRKTEKNIYVKNMNSQTPQLKNLDHNRHSRTFVKMNNKKAKKMSQ